MTTAAVIGGGIGGLASAIALRAAGVEARLYEQAPELTEIGAGLSLWANASKALAELGVGEPLTELASPLRSLESRTPAGRLLHRVSLKPVDENFGFFSAALHRGELLQLLVDRVPPGDIVTNSPVTGVGFEDDRPVVSFKDTSRIDADLIVGADGISSTVRGSLFPKATPVYAGYSTWRGISSIDPPKDWPAMGLVRILGRGEYFGIGEISPGRFLWYATKNRPLAGPEPGGRKATVLRHFGSWHSPVRELIEATPANDILLHPVFKMKPLAGWSRGSVTLLGDAAHPIEPSIGMGACLAIEDALVLGAAIRQADDVSEALALYERTRRPRVRKMVRWSHRLARSEQMDNPLLCWSRDLGTRLTPPSLTQGFAVRTFDFAVP